MSTEGLMVRVVGYDNPCKYVRCKGRKTVVRVRTHQGTWIAVHVNTSAVHRVGL
jgi:hypothetical protein